VATTPTDTLLPLGIFPCADGFVAMMMTTQQLDEMLTVLGSDELRAAFAAPDAFTNPITKEILDGVLYPWLLSRTREEVTVAAQAAGWPVTPVNEPEVVLQADHLFQRGFWVHTVDQELGSMVLPGAPYRFAEGGWTLRRSAPVVGQSEPVDDVESQAPAFTATDPKTPPLFGIRVLDMTTVWSGPFVTQNLADLGAEVIRIETPLVFPPTTKGYVPRPTRAMSLGALAMLYAPLTPGQTDRPYNRHALNNSVGRGKLSCTLDVRLPRQRELFMQLVAKSDVFIENLKASTLHQMGIHETELLKVNPRLIVLRIPPAGLTGDWSHYTGFGAQFDGLTGLAALCGHRGTNLMESPSTMHMDSATGPAGAFALLAALHYRSATGRGQVIEMAQSENVLSQLGEVFVNLQRGVATIRQGNRDQFCAPQGVFPCAGGGWLALTVTDDAAWAGLTKVMDRPDLARDPRFADVAGRQTAHDEIDSAIAEWTKGVQASEVFHVLQRAGVAAAPIADDAMFAEDPQLKARGWIRPLESRDVGTFNHLGQMFQGLPLAWERGAPTLGQDNRYVFQEVLGLDDAAYEELVADRIAVEDYLDKDGVPY
jgi:crotonobetainyl-CoA:carnitine CoA-transferase CaiB-like acyl-CoA transferase